MTEEFKPCQGFDDPCYNKNAVRYRQRTAYQDDEMNYRTLCPSCKEANDEYWNDMWNEYYGSIL